MLRVFVRVYSGDNKKSRPHWYTKALCVKSVLIAVEQARVQGIDVEAVLVVDINQSSPLAADVAKLALNFDHVIGVAGGSARRSWRGLLKVLRKWDAAPDDIIYVVEDDHLHIPTALTLLNSGTGDYRFLYSMAVDRISDSESNPPAETWCALESGVSSFATRYKTLHEDAWVHWVFSYGGGGWDELTCRALGHGARNALGTGGKYISGPSSIRGLRAHVQNMWWQLSRIMAIFVGRLRPSRDIRALLPAGATHAESVHLAEGVNWDLVAEKIRNHPLSMRTRNEDTHEALSILMVEESDRLRSALWRSLANI